MGDARIEIEAAMEGDEEALPVALVQDRRRIWPKPLAAAVVTAGLALAWILIPPRPERSEVFRAAVVLAPGTIVAPVFNGNLRLSPRGDRVLFIPGDGANLIVRDLTTGDFLELERTGRASFPFWSPDGEWIAYFAGQQLMKIPSRGGPVQIITDAPNGRGGSWSTNGLIVFSPDPTSPLMKVPQGGGTLEPVTSPTENVGHRNPHFLPNGRHFLYTEIDSASRAGRVVLGSIEGTEPTLIVGRGSNPQFANGHILFVRDRILMAQRFDPRTHVTEGPARTLAEAVEYFAPRSIGNYSVSEEGLLAYRQRHRRPKQVVWIRHDGTELETVGEPMPTDFLASLDEKANRAALRIYDQTGLNKDLWLLDLDRGQLVRATSMSTPSGIHGALSASGERLAVRSFAGGTSEAGSWLQAATGGSVEPLPDGFLPRAWSHDGRYLLGSAQTPADAMDITYIDLQRDREVRTLITGPAFQSDASPSPDGRWLAYNSNETGKFELYVTDFPQAQQKWLVSESIGTESRELIRRWSPDGRTLYYSDSHGVFEVPFEPGDPPRIGEPELILAKDPKDNINAVVAVVDDRLLTLKFASAPVEEPIRLIQNWQRLVED
jgi:Tol biopolymer transport system component